MACQLTMVNEAGITLGIAQLPSKANVYKKPVLSRLSKINKSQIDKVYLDNKKETSFYASVFPELTMQREITEEFVQMTGKYELPENTVVIVLEDIKKVREMVIALEELQEIGFDMEWTLRQKTGLIQISGYF